MTTKGTGQYGDLVGAWFDIVGYMEVTLEGVHRLHFRESAKFLAKSRYNLSVDYIDNPCFEDIVNLVNGGNDVEQVD